MRPVPEVAGLAFAISVASPIGLVELKVFNTAQRVKSQRAQHGFAFAVSVSTPTADLKWPSHWPRAGGWGWARSHLSNSRSQYQFPRSADAMSQRRS